MTSPLDALKTWFTASRPYTLSAGVVPVGVGGALAASQGLFSWGLWVLTLAGALLVQIGTNLTDEFADHGATASAHKYLAPHKVIARGLLSEAAVKAGAAAVFALATLIGAYLVWRTGWPLLVLCLVSLAAAYAYSAGPLPLGNYALGEPLVFVMMGPVMVAGTVYVQTVRWEPLALWFALPVGALVTAILMANNLRDAEEDRATRRRTLVTVLGPARVRRAHHALTVLAYLCVAVAWTAGWSGPWVLLPWLTLPLAWRVGRLLHGDGERARLHRALKGTSALHAAFGLLLALGLLIQGLGGGGA
jgi:1,4-dihydroxy-2-naphthoate octaprenyltransferase